MAGMPIHSALAWLSSPRNRYGRLVQMTTGPGYLAALGGIEDVHEHLVLGGGVGLDEYVDHM